MIRVAVEARARQLLWHFNEYRVFRPSETKCGLERRSCGMQVR